MTTNRPRARNAGRRILRRIHRRLGLHRAFLPVVLRLTPLGPARTVTRDTDLVIEGFPRSGNTWTAFAFRHANPGLQIASHAHVPAQVHRAVALGRPTLIIVREPLDTLASLLVAAPHVGTRQAIHDYIRHHRALLDHRHRAVVADFADVVHDLAVVATRIEQAFGLALHTPHPDQEPSIHAAIAAHHERIHGRDPWMSPRPDTARRSANERARARLLDPAMTEDLRRATRLYEQLQA